jgi:hypothetical protein
MSADMSGEKYTSLIREPPMSRAIWLMYSASWLGRAMLGLLLGAPATHHHDHHHDHAVKCKIPCHGQRLIDLEGNWMSHGWWHR